MSPAAPFTARDQKYFFMSVPGVYTMFLRTLCKNKSYVYALQASMLSFVLLFLLSCAATVQNGQQLQNSQLLAENSMMKKRLPLMERESDVLKKENEQHRMRIQELETQNKQLDLDLVSLHEQYERDKAVGAEQISILQQTLHQNEQENKASIDALNADNKVLGEKMVRDSRQLNEQIVTQKAAFNQEKKKLLREYGQMESKLTGKLDVANKKLAAKELEISSLQSSIAAFSGKLDKANALSAELTKARDASLVELEAIKAAGVKSSKEYLMQLEAIKAANVDLNKKITELSSDLSHPKNIAPVPIKQP